MGVDGTFYQALLFVRAKYLMLMTGLNLKIGSYEKRQ